MNKNSDNLKSSPLMNKIHKQNVDELRRNSISPGRRSVSKNANNANVAEDRPTTSRKVPNPSPELYCDYVIPSPKTKREQNKKLVIENEVNYDEMNRGIDNANDDDLQTLTRYLKQLTERVDKIETKVEVNATLEDRPKRKRAESPFAHYDILETPQSEEEKQEEVYDDYEEVEPQEDHGEESESGEDDSKVTPRSSEEETETRSPYRPTKEIYKDYEKVNNLFQTLNSILPSASPEKKKETIQRMEELIKISDRLKEEHNLSSSWEDRNPSTQVPQEEEEKEETSSEEYEPPQPERKAEKKMRPASEISSDIKQVKMLFTALKESMNMCKPNEWSNNVMTIFSNRFNELESELRLAETYYKDHSLTPERQNRSTNTENQNSSAPQSEPAKKSPFYSSQPTKPCDQSCSCESAKKSPFFSAQPTKPCGQSCPCESAKKSPFFSAQPTKPCGQSCSCESAKKSPFYSAQPTKPCGQSCSCESAKKSPFYSSQPVAQPCCSQSCPCESAKKSPLFSAQPPKPCGQSCSCESAKNPEQFRDSHPTERHSFSQIPKEEPIVIPRPNSEPNLDLEDDLDEDYDNYNDNDIQIQRSLEEEIQALQNEFSQLQQDLTEATTNEQRQNILARLMDLEKRFKVLNQQMAELENQQPRSNESIKQDLDDSMKEFVGLKNEMPTADSERQGQIFLRMTELKRDIDYFTKELDENSLPPPSRKPKQQVQQPLSTDSVMSRMIRIKGKFEEYKKALETATPDQAREILRNVDDLMKESQELEKCMLAMKGQVGAVPVTQPRRSPADVAKLTTFEQIQDAINENQNRYKIITEKLEKDPSTLVSCQQELKELEEYSLALQSRVRELSHQLGNTIPESIPEDDSEEEEEEEIDEEENENDNQLGALLQQFETLRTKMSNCPPEDIPKYRKELESIQNKVEQLKTVHKTDSSNDEVIKRLLLDGAAKCSVCNSDEEKKGFLRQYFKNRLPSLAANETLMSRFVDTCIEISHSSEE